MDLFPSLPITKSPKLLWMERHKIAVYPSNDGSEYLAGNGTITKAGDTEDAALTALALAAGIKLWNEEVV
jgi:hypothetical protein